MRALARLLLALALPLTLLSLDVGSALAQGTLRIGMTASDIPYTGGQSDNGFEGFRFVGYQIYEPLIQWDLTRADRLAALVPGLAESWEVRKDAPTKGATGRARYQRADDGTLRVTDVANKGSGRFDAGEGAAVTPIGRMAFPGSVLEEFEEVGRALPAGAELDDVPVLQRLARRGALAGVLSEARFFDVGVPEGYRDAVASFPPRP